MMLGMASLQPGMQPGMQPAMPFGMQPGMQPFMMPGMMPTARGGRNIPFKSGNSNQFQGKPQTFKKVVEIKK